jgi:D-lactate dehydrogenase (cytochrome)
LFVGSEGTLGIITEVTLKLHPWPQAISSAVCSFGTLHDAVETAIEIIQSGIAVARIELLDEVMMRGINGYSGLGYREAPTLFFEFHGTEAGVAEQAEFAQAAAAGHGGLGFEWARLPEERTRLWHARDNTLYAGLSLRPGARAMITDVCVPISRLAECLVETRRDVDATGLMAPVVGHVGDGNFHMLILIDPADAAEIARAKALHARMVARALAVEGTCTGEHGIGLGKIGFLKDELGESVDIMRSIKAALDPQGLMNPGKIFLPLPELHA